MKYINKNTRAIIDTPCSISGGDWILYEDLNKSEEVKSENMPAEEVKSENTLTKEAIMNELDALGISYDKNTKKEDLYKLMMGE